MSAWTVTAMTRLKTTLEADSRLSTYVDSFSIRDRLRDDEVPTMTRHAIVLIPGAKTVTPRTPSTSLETFSVTVRLVVRVWDPVNHDEIVTSDTVVGVGTSEVGMLQFAEDVANALRKQELSSLLEMSAVECDGMPSLTPVPSADTDTVFYETLLTWVGQYKGYHDPTLRS